MILVFGKTGQVARALQTVLPAARFLGRDEADLAQPEACAEWITRLSPEAVINAAAYTAVDKAEEEEELATAVNGAAPGCMAEACAGLGIPFVHISTDYVFDGAGETPFNPEGSTAPLGAYGRSKLAGEKAVRAAGGVSAILRTSWVFSATGSNFVKTMLRLGAERDKLTIVADQVGGPTPARAIAEACAAIARQLVNAPDRTGTYHFSGAPDVSWAEFARCFFELAGLKVEVEDIPSSAYKTPAVRPLNSRMDCASLSRFGLSRPDWRAELQTVIDELRE